MSSEILLTIAIPTYNRSQYLDLCLKQICKQLDGHENIIELLVSNNNSTDGTDDTIKKYINQGFNIHYIKNIVNIGADANFAQCFKKAKGKYVLIFGDDDALLEGALSKIIRVLSGGEYGIVYLSSYGFTGDFDHNRPIQAIIRNQTIVYDDINDFIDDVNYWVTFISGNIVNKSLIKNEIDIEQFLDTSLIQLSWIFSALLQSKQNVVIKEYLVAAKGNNTGGYELCKVFGTNMNKIMQTFVSKGLSQKSISIINNNLLLSFFPGFIIKLRRDRETFQDKDFFDELYPIYKTYLLFWLIIVPITKLPLILASIYLIPIKIINRLLTLYKR